ncbi:hypothetical protein BZA77DRAFT_385709 [Pyronema omphalodes]|nr:hypothetical protein BZA77DRAFT_385709 [Pyronema omphalodes]
MEYVDNTGINPHNYSQTTPLTRTEDTSQPVSSTLVAIKKLQTDYEDFHAWMKSATKALSLIPSPILKAGILYDPPTPPALGPVKDEYSVSHQIASWPSISTSTSQYFHSPPPISQAGENRNDLSTERQYDVLNPDPTPRIHSSPIMDITTTNPLNDQNTSYLSRPLQCPFCPGLWFYTSTEYRGHQSIRHPIRQQYPSLLEIMMPEENVQPTELISTEPTPTQPTEPIEPTETTPTDLHNAAIISSSQSRYAPRQQTIQMWNRRMYIGFLFHGRVGSSCDTVAYHGTEG